MWLTEDKYVQILRAMWFTDLFISTVFSCSFSNTAIAEDDEKNLRDDSRVPGMSSKTIVFLWYFQIPWSIYEEFLLFLRRFWKRLKIEKLHDEYKGKSSLASKSAYSGIDIAIGLILLQNVAGEFDVNPIYSLGRCRSNVLLIQIPNFIYKVFWLQHWSRFVLADDLHINILEFVAGHGAVVQPASITIVFGYKKAQQYSRKHQFGFIRAVSWSAQNAESHWWQVHNCISLLQ